MKVKINTTKPIKKGKYIAKPTPPKKYKIKPNQKLI